MLYRPMDSNAQVDGQEILCGLRAFITGATRPSDANVLNLVKTAISLLKTLPAAREAILEYFSTVFQNYVSKYVALLEDGAFTVSTSAESDALLEDEIPLVEIQNVLCNFVKRNPEAWAPIISTWSLELLGAISSRQINQQFCRSLNDRLQLWTACGATQTLLDINTLCMSCLMHSNTDACISALLDMNVHVHFDWVVVHVGSSFPETVVNKVLTCGLKDFRDNEQADENSKLKSVVRILEHLTNTHFTEIKNALTNLFKWSLEEAVEDKATSMLKVATVPYLLDLAWESPMLLKALSADTLQSLNINVFLRLSSLANDWCPFFKGKLRLLDLVVKLLLRLENGVYYTLNMLFEMASIPTSDSTLSAISNTAQGITELLICDIDVELRSSDKIPPLVRTFYRHLPALKSLLLASDNLLKSSYITRLLIVLGRYNKELLSSCIAFLLNRASSDVQIERLLEVSKSMNDINIFDHSFRLALQYETLEFVIIDERVNCPLNLWRNTRTLLQYDVQENSLTKSVLLGLVCNFRKIVEFLKQHHCDLEMSRIIVSIISILIDHSPRPLSVDEIMVLTESIVLYFFSSVVCEKDTSCLSSDCRSINSLLEKCSVKSKISRNLAMRSLVSTAIFTPVSPVFGAVVKPDSESIATEQTSLLRDNIKLGSTLMVAQSAMSVFHTGIIGNGKREAMIRANLPTERIKCNTQVFMDAVRACCLRQTETDSIEAVTTLALLLVQFVSSDVMFNGLPWPDEEFCKVTIERDLHIRNMFDETPLLWALLKFVAIHRPALCTCSVLLRGVAATLMSQWSSASQGRLVKQNVQTLQTTCELLDVLTLGQLLPSPLSGIRDIISYLQPHHVIILMKECVWNYMRDHVPSPALFSRDNNGTMWRDPAFSKPTKQYTETLRMVLLKNIDRLGEFYHQFFNQLNVENE